MIEDSEALLNQPGSTYPLPPFYKRLFNGIDPVISGSGEVQGARRTHRRLHDQRLFLRRPSQDIRTIESTGNPAPRNPSRRVSHSSFTPIGWACSVHRAIASSVGAEDPTQYERIPLR